jgi:hypothetical protein
VELWRAVGPIWATGIALFAGFPITGSLLALAVWAHGSETGRALELWRSHRALLAPMAVVPLIWAWSATFARGGQADPLEPWKSHGVVALLALAFALALALLIRYRRQWRAVGPYLALEAWVALVAAFVGLWWIEGWPSL